AAFNTVAAAAQAAIAASPGSDSEQLTQRGTLAAALADPKVSQSVREHLGDGLVGGIGEDFKDALKASESAEDLTAVLAFQLANAAKLDEELPGSAEEQAGALQFLAKNFDALGGKDAVRTLSSVFT